MYEKEEAFITIILLETLCRWLNAREYFQWHPTMNYTSKLFGQLQFQTFSPLLLI